LAILTLLWDQRCQDQATGRRKGILALVQKEPDKGPPEAEGAHLIPWGEKALIWIWRINLWPTTTRVRLPSSLLPLLIK